jgi:hypothetical protein
LAARCFHAPAKKANQPSLGAAGFSDRYWLRASRSSRFFSKSNA